MSGLTNKQMFYIILLLIVSGVGISLAVFFESRADANVRIAALTAATTVAATLIGVVATLLTGKDTHQSPSDFPPGSSVTSSQQETVRTPPASAITQTTETSNVTPSPTISSTRP